MLFVYVLCCLFVVSSPCPSGVKSAFMLITSSWAAERSITLFHTLYNMFLMTVFSQCYKHIVCVICILSLMLTCFHFHFQI